MNRETQLLDRVLMLERNLIRARKHLQRIYDSSDKAGVVEGECSSAIQAINTALDMSRSDYKKVATPKMEITTA